jgi:hypothetical protein
LTINVSFGGLLFKSGLDNSGTGGAYPNFLVQVRVFRLATRNFGYRVFRVRIRVFRIWVLGIGFFCPILLLDLYCSKSCFWTKAGIAFGPFGWLLPFPKTKIGLKAQPKRPEIKAGFLPHLAFIINFRCLQILIVIDLNVIFLLMKTLVVCVLR